MARADLLAMSMTAVVFLNVMVLITAQNDGQALLEKLLFGPDIITCMQSNVVATYVSYLKVSLHQCPHAMGVGI